MNATKTVFTGLEPTKLIIVQTALTLFSEFGIEGVSLSKLREQAGQQNRSAIHYHFENKEGLLTAVTAHVGELLATELSATLALFDTDELDPSKSLAEVLTVLYSPLIAFFFSGDIGKACIRYISHMAREVEDFRRDMAFQPLKPLLDVTYKATSRFFKSSTPEENDVRLYLATVAAIEMLVCSDMLVRKHEVAGHEMSSELNDDFRKKIIAFMAAGMLSLG